MNRFSWATAICIISVLLSLTGVTTGQEPSMVILSNIEIVTVEEDLMVVTWVTNLASDTTVLYGESGSLDNIATGEGDSHFHYCRISGLESDTDYSFQVSSDGSTSVTRTFMTLPQRPSSTTRIAIVADIHYDTDGTNTPNGAMYGNSPDLLAAFLDEFDNRDDIEAVILLGDNVQGDESDWTAFYDENLKPHSMTYYPVLGNSDKTSPDWETYYTEHVCLPSSYFSIDLGGLHLIILDSAAQGQVGGELDSDQFDWLENDLSENSDIKVLIFMHHLYYVDDIMGLDQGSFDRLKSIVDENPNILNIFSGHNHRNTYSGSGERTQTTSVASLVQYPIGYATLDLWEDGYSQSFYKVQETLDISENSRIRIQASNADPEEDVRYLGTLFERNHILTYVEDLNTRPEIFSVTSTEEVIGPGEETAITVDAFDADWDPLEYIYKVGEGEIIGSGPAVIYRAPDREGQFGIEVIVSDGLMESKPYNILIKVEMDPEPEPEPEPEPVDNRPPRIENVIATPLKISVNGEVGIRVYATDPDDDPIEYEYSYVYGEIIGEGNDVTWKAPSSMGSHTVTVIVTDGYSHSDPEVINIEVYKEEPETKDSPYLSLLFVITIPFIIAWTLIIRRPRKK